MGYLIVVMVLEFMLVVELILMLVVVGHQELVVL